MIQVKNLTKLYGTHLAVDDISFKVKKGRIYGFLGPNGAGKSTTMNMITGYIAPTIGTITINGHDLGKETLEAKKCIGYLPENPPLYQDMYVKEYLEFVAKLKKTDKAKRSAEIDEIMKKTGLNDVSGRLIKNLSKGYKQRVGIAQALLGNPEIVILDEPTVGLDPEQIIEIRTLIKSLKKNHTVILSSHILSEISAVCDEVLMIAKGKVVAMDTTENILKMNKGGQRITITVKGEASKAEEVLKKLKCLESYKLIAQAKGQASFELEVKETKKDVREEVSFALSDARILIIEMNMSKASLEDVYLDILQECREAEEAEEDADDNLTADSKENEAEGGEES
ncbi:MAG: ATP-binding cassette domain-containing protein [Lachnospiraceae bacterium]|nr:ATP-binding cassette domain-containing protein [Lachnospiraceae bacterium]